MTDIHQHWLLRLYPRAWRDRYGDELSDLIASEALDWRVVLDVAMGAAKEHLSTAYLKGETIMVACRGSAAILLRTPSAYLPIAMSALALMLALGNILLFGVGRQPDEGAAAHIFQLLVIGQMPLIAWFFFRRLRTHRTGTLAIVALQAISIGAALFPVWYYGL